jgi:biopolymer transport protein ExbD
MKRRWRKRRKHEPAELNITAFLNLMVILVPFLLMTAVFSRLAVLELNLPVGQAQASEPAESEFALEITVRGDRIEVGDRATGLISAVRSTVEGYDYAELATQLRRIKQRFPEKTDATVLLEPDINYQVLVEVMDTIRMSQQTDARDGRMSRAELFPEISIGDAPLRN